MSLTLGHGPLAAHAASGNYRLDGPAHKLFFDDFPRRVRAVFADEAIFDTRRGKLLHETGRMPQLYVVRDDVRGELLEQSQHKTHCPFKGEASYWSVRVGERVAANAVWAYPQAHEETYWLRGYLAFTWEALDAWFDEDEEVQGHLRDPYHRVDVRASSQHVRVLADAEVIGETDLPMVVSETGLPNRFYLPVDDVHREYLEFSERQSICPYKGTASYYNLRLGERLIENAAWYYSEPLEDAAKVREHLCFDLAEDLTVEVDGKTLS